MDQRPPRIKLKRRKDGQMEDMFPPNWLPHRQQNGYLKYWMYQSNRWLQDIQYINERISSNEVRMLQDGDYDDSDIASSHFSLKNWKKQIIIQRNKYLGKITENTC